MNLEFGVAYLYHHAGAPPKYLDGHWFKDYDSAAEHARRFCDECAPTIYLVVNRKWVFYCERSAVCNEPYVVYSIQVLPGNVGQVETRIWWSEFIKDPEKYLHYAESVLN